MHTIPAYTPKIGDIVVIYGFVGDYFSPVTHNSVEFPDHPCRGRVLKIGPKWIHVSTIGAPWRVPVNPTSMSWRVLTPELARTLYREALEHYGRDPKFIDKCVDSL